jgi:hypothetical protein
MVPLDGDAGRLALPAANIPVASSSTPARTDISAPGQAKSGKGRHQRRSQDNGPIEIAIDRLVDYSDNDILDELRRVAALVKERELTVKRFKPLARICYSTVHHRFGCWASALLKAGLGDRRSENRSADRRRAIATKAMTDRQVGTICAVHPRPSGGAPMNGISPAGKTRCEYSWRSSSAQEIRHPRRRRRTTWPSLW